MIEYLQYLSILIEFVVALMGLMIYVQKKKIYGIGIFTTFLIYVFYDTEKLINIPVSSEILYLEFLIATISIALSVWIIYTDKKK